MTAQGRRPHGSGASRLGDLIRTSLWPVPTLGIVVALVGAVLLTHLDRSIGQVLPDGFTYWIFGGDADAARSILGSLAGSLITVTSLTFSLTVVTLQLASSQFSPRLLRTFASDRMVHATLALFLGTFVFALTVLRTVRSSTDDGDEFVPQISVTVAYLLTIASVVALVLFLAHIAKEIRIETMLTAVQREALETVRRTLTDLETTGDNSRRPDSEAVPLVAARSGFLTHVQTADLCRAATDLDIVVMVTAPTGGSVVENTPAGLAWPTRSDRILTDDERGKAQESFNRAVGIGFERTSVDDVGFGLRQLTDIAARALSPGINDPTTAAHAVGHSSALLCALTRLPLGDELIRQENGTVRVVVRRPPFGELLTLAVDQPRRYGAGEPQVAERLFQLLDEVSWTAHEPGQRSVLRAELDRLWSAVQGQSPEITQLERYEELYARVDSTLRT